MRSSKSRSRGKGNRNRSPSNNINRVFDSSGPEGKVRGTPQQVIDKYTQLSRDAFLANDRVAGENFQQHAEHYARLLSEAQRDADSKRQNQQNQQNQQGQQGGNQNGNNGNNAGNEGGKPNGKSDRQDRDAQRRREKQANREQQENFDPGSAPQPDVFEPEAEADSGLVETPEEKPKKKRAPRKPKAEKAEAEQATGDDSDGAPEAAE